LSATLIAPTARAASATARRSVSAIVGFDGVSTITRRAPRRMAATRPVVSDCSTSSANAEARQQLGEQLRRPHVVAGLRDDAVARAEQAEHHRRDRAHAAGGHQRCLAALEPGDQARDALVGRVAVACVEARMAGASRHLGELGRVACGVRHRRVDGWRQRAVGRLVAIGVDQQRIRSFGRSGHGFGVQQAGK